MQILSPNGYGQIYVHVRTNKCILIIGWEISQVNSYFVGKGRVYTHGGGPGAPRTRQWLPKPPDALHQVNLVIYRYTY